MDESLAPPPKASPPDWSIGDLYRRSWELIKKHKVLWVFGMVLAVFTGGGINTSNGLNNISDVLLRNGAEEKTSESAQGVLGEATTALDSIGQLFSTIPPFFWVLLVLQIILLILTVWVIGLISQSWANAGLIQAIKAGLDGGTPTIRDASEKAFPSIKSLIWLAIVPILILLGISIVVFGVLAIGLAVSPFPLKAILGILLFVAIIAFLLAFLVLILSLIWAERKVILDQKPAFLALKEGFALVRKKKWPMLLLGLVNTVLGWIITLVPLTIIGLFTVVGIIGAVNSNLAIAIPFLSIAGLLFLIFIFGFILVSGILTAFKASTWTIAYLTIRSKYHGNA